MKAVLICTRKQMTGCNCPENIHHFKRNRWVNLDLHIDRYISRNVLPTNANIIVSMIFRTNDIYINLLLCFETILFCVLVGGQLHASFPLWKIISIIYNYRYKRVWQKFHRLLFNLFNLNFKDMYYECWKMFFFIQCKI